MRSEKLLLELGRFAVFETGTVASIASMSPEYTRLAVHRLKKAGRLHELGRGTFTVHNDAFLVASRISWPSYITMWSALRYHDMTEQVPHAVWVVSPKRRRRAELELGNSRIRFVFIRPEMMFGYSKVRYGDFDVFVAEPEKAVIDALLLHGVSIPELNEMIGRNMRKLDVPRLVRYARMTGNAALERRLGRMLDGFGVDRYAQLRQSSYRTPVLLDPLGGPGGAVDAKWGVRENVSL